MSLDIDILSLSTAETPPQCESPVPCDSDNVSARVIRLSMEKLSNKKHSAHLRHATLIKSVHRQALQHALESAWLDESDCNFEASDSLESNDVLDEPSDPALHSQSMWDIVDEWETQGARKRCDDDMECDYEVCFLSSAFASNTFSFEGMHGRGF
jgi:hypothetical protein